MTEGKFYTPFQEPWWLDATAPGQWDAVEVERGGQLQAYLPFVVGERNGARFLEQPFLTQSLGPWIADTGAGYTNTLSREMSLYKELIDGLPDHDVFKQHFATQVTNWLPFYWEGFTQTTRYTYTLDMRQSLEELHKGMDKRNRSRINKGKEQLVLTESETEGLETLLDLSEMTFERQGMQLPYSRAFVRKLDEAVQKHSRRLIVIARGKEDGLPHAANYAFGDSKRVYALMSGADPALRQSGASVVARWRTIEWAHTFTETFDFEGSMVRGIEHRNRKYGAHQTPYFSIRWSNGVLEANERKRQLRRAPLVAAWRLKEAALKPFR